MPIGRKFWFGLFDQGATKSISKIFHWREFFAPETEGRSPECFPPVIFMNFGRLLDENFGSVFLTVVRPEAGIAFWGATKWSNFQIFALEREFCSGTWRQWSRNYPFWKFHPFLPPHGRKLQIGLFDRRASKWWFWPSCDQNPCLVVLTVVRLLSHLGTFDQWCD